MSSLKPWDFNPPAVLYKYLRPERIDILNSCRIRFSQRKVFEDNEELSPPVRAFGTEAEIRVFMNRDDELRELPEWLREAAIRRLEEPRIQEAMGKMTVAQMKGPDEYAVLSLTEDRNSPQMWERYAGGGRGFAIGFNTTSSGFRFLQSPGRLGKVSYREEVLETYLGDYGAEVFFHKRKRYAFEKEWRSIRHIRHLKLVDDDERQLPIYLSRFSPGSVAEIIIPPGMRSGIPVMPYCWHRFALPPNQAYSPVATASLFLPLGTLPHRTPPHRCHPERSEGPAFVFHSGRLRE